MNNKKTKHIMEKEIKKEVKIFSEKYEKGTLSEKSAKANLEDVKNKLNQEGIKFLEEDDGCPDSRGNFYLKVFVQGESLEKVKKIILKDGNNHWYQWFKKNLLL